MRRLREAELGHEDIGRIPGSKRAQTHQPRQRTVQTQETSSTRGKVYKDAAQSGRYRPPAAAEKGVADASKTGEKLYRACDLAFADGAGYT